jgi:hypothetical protein
MLTKLPPLLALLFIAALISAQDGGRDVPPLEGDAAHHGQPRWCQAKDANGYKHNCACKAMGNDEAGHGMCDNAHGDPRCSTYCRKNACTCHTADCGATR